MDIISEKRFDEIIGKVNSVAPILVVGDVGIDRYTFGEVNRISPEAPVPIIEVTKEWHKLGLAANVTDNLQSLNIPSTLCGVIGDDRNGDLLETLLEEANLKTWGMVRSSSRPTTFKERVTTNIQQICRVDYETKQPLDQDAEVRLTQRIADFSKDHSALIVEDYGKGLFSQKFTQKIIEKYRDENKIIAVDPSRDTDPNFYKGATLLKPNKLESTLMAKSLGYATTDVNEIASILVDKLNIEKVIITLGAEGMAMLDTTTNGKLVIIPTAASEVFDVSGAGDTAISAITSSLLAGATLEEAAWIGNCASGVVVGKKGTANVTVEELKSFYQIILKRKS